MNIKTELIIGSLITLIGLGAVGYYFFGYRNSMAALPTTQAAQTTSTTSASPMTPSSPTLTMADVAVHNSKDNCWIVINQKALNVTPFLKLHPGGAEAITMFCGQDATAAFNGIKDGRGHSSQARANMENFLIGLLGQDVAI